MDAIFRRGERTVTQIEVARVKQASRAMDERRELALPLEEQSRRRAERAAKAIAECDRESARLRAAREARLAVEAKTRVDARERAEIAAQRCLWAVKEQ